MEPKIVDHLFRHEYGKMVAVLSRTFGLGHLELIEDAVQDTFVKATLQWRRTIPEKPEAWLMKTARNRVIDLLRKIKADNLRHHKISYDPVEIPGDFPEHQVEDSQLRMLFVACHPVLSPQEQIAFSLKTISGFSLREIAAGLLMKEETIKKRLARTRNKIRHIDLTRINPAEFPNRLTGVLQIIYLIFNEGFHSTKTTRLISKELCGEAIRLCKLLLNNESLRSGDLYALFALMCFHAARLDSKVSPENELVDLRHQDRSKWYMPLIILGNDALNKALEYSEWGAYHYEAAIAGEYIRAVRFENTDWNRILSLHQKLFELQPSDTGLLNIASVYLQLGELDRAHQVLDEISAPDLHQRLYLLHACYSELFLKKGVRGKALEHIEKALDLASNNLERNYLLKKKGTITD